MPTNENEETKTVEQEPAQKDSVDEFIEAAKEVKKNSIPREEYEKLRADNKKLMDYILEGKELEIDEGEKTPDIAELKKVFRDPESTNLEIVSASLGIRKAVIEKTGKDPFSANEKDEAAAAKVAEVFQQCVDEAAGDNEKFTYLLRSRIADDDSALINAINKRRRK